MATLITGGCGFVGINVAEELISQGDRVVLLDRHRLPDPANSAFQACGVEPTVILGDVRDSAKLTAVLRDFEIERVIHAAVITPDPLRESSAPKEIIEVNVQGTVNVLDAARTVGCRRVLCVSSGAAYGKALYGPGPLREEISASLPETIYGITKFTAEQIAFRLGSLWALNVICVRLGSVFGPWEFDTLVRDRLSPQFQLAQLAVRGGTALLPAQEVRRDWVYSRDVASGLVRLLKAADPRYTSYHLSSGVEWQHAILNWCQELRRAYSRFSWRVATGEEKPNVNYHADRDRATMDITRLVTDIGFMPKFVEHDAHDDYIGWILKNQDFMNFEFVPMIRKSLCTAN